MEEEPLEQPSVSQGTPEWAVIRRAYWLVEAMQRLKNTVSTGDEPKIQNAISGVEYCLRDMRRIIREVDSEVKEIKGKPPIRPPDV